MSRMDLSIGAKEKSSTPCKATMHGLKHEV